MATTINVNRVILGFEGSGIHPNCGDTGRSRVICGGGVMNVLGLKLTPVPDLPGVGVVPLEGAIDARTVGALQILLSASTSSAFKIVILDLEEIRYINSAGMSYLVGLSDTLGSRGGTLYLSTPQPKVKLVLEMMGLTELFNLYPSRSSVLRALQVGRRTSLSKLRTRSRASKSPSLR